MKNFGFTIIAAALILLFISPFFHMILMSFKRPLDLFSTFLFFDPTVSNYFDVFSRLKLDRYFVNSLIVALASGGISVFLGTLSAFSFARFAFPGRKIILFLFLFVRMMPPVGAIVPLFLLMRNWGLTNTYPGLILLYTALQTPFVIWMMRGFFLSVPRELEESAQIDGCSQIGSFFKITFPLSAPGLAATAIFAFTLSWNEFLFALIFTASRTKTVPVAVPELIGEMGILWGQICAAGTLAVLPVFIFAFVVQKHLIKGLTFGAVKG